MFEYRYASGCTWKFGFFSFLVWHSRDRFLFETIVWMLSNFRLQNSLCQCSWTEWPDLRSIIEISESNWTFSPETFESLEVKSLNSFEVNMMSTEVTVKVVYPVKWLNTRKLEERNLAKGDAISRGCWLWIWQWINRDLQRFQNEKRFANSWQYRTSPMEMLIWILRRFRDSLFGSGSSLFLIEKTLSDRACY